MFVKRGWLSECTGISFVDSTPLRVCKNQRILIHKTFAGIAARCKCLMGWFYGFKLPEDSYFFPVNDGAINVYTAKSWKSMKQNGAVFLPEAGFRRGIEPSTFGGYYWSSTADVHLSGYAYSIDFACSDVMKRLANTNLGHAVRLVKDL